jgi:hypothetical protein
MILAQKMNIVDFPSPAGGCRLTDKNYSIRLQDLLVNNQLNLKQIKYLAYGRHFRLSPSVKLVIGRDENENLILENMIDHSLLLTHIELPSPLGVLIGEPSIELVNLAASILAHYITKSEGPLKINYSADQSFSEYVIVDKIQDSKMQDFMIK